MFNLWSSIILTFFFFLNCWVPSCSCSSAVFYMRHLYWILGFGGFCACWGLSCFLQFVKFPWNCNPLVCHCCCPRQAPVLCRLNNFICHGVIGDTGVGQIQARHSKNLSLKGFDKLLLITSHWVLLCGPEQVSLPSCWVCWARLHWSLPQFKLWHLLIFPQFSKLLSISRKEISCFNRLFWWQFVTNLWGFLYVLISRWWFTLVFLDFWGSVQPSLSSAPFSATLKMCCILGLFRSF